MGFSAADVLVPAGVNTLVLALLACLLLALVLYARLSRSRHQLRTRLRAANSQLDQMRGRDAVTGLMTRPEFETLLDAAVQDSDTRDAPLAVLYIGLDNFQSVNDAYGLTAGDALLQQVARRLEGLPGRGGAVSRLVGDEFALLLKGRPEAADALAARLQEELRAPFRVEGHELLLTASIGIAVYPDHASRPRLLAHAGLAMRSVKLGGGGGHTHFDPAMCVDLRGQAEMVQDLRHAVERGQLQLYFQPKIDARSLKITAAEALLRWQHPRRGMISPVVFIPLAERHGLIVDIGHWVIEEACRQAAQWREQGLRMRVAVNLSGHQLRQDDLVERLQSSLRRHGIPPGRLTCEITETVAMEDTNQTRTAFERLRRAGLHVSIDDFGTGHSSLAALRRLPAAELKIDRGFVTDLASSGEARTIVKAIVQMAHTLDLRVVAEGVETESQRDALLALGCDELQGFLFAKPMSADAIAMWASDDRSLSAQEGSDPTDFRPSLFEATAPAPLDDEPAPG